MAQYRLSITRASRKDGRTATAMAAYRAGVMMEDKRTGLTFDYTRKSGILHSEIFLPADAPEWAHNRNELWNRSEFADKRSDAQIAREVQLSLPYEMNDDQRRDITQEYADYLTDRFKVAVDVAIHEPSRNGDERNYHAHLLLCTRPFDDESKTGFGNKNRELDAVAQKKLGQSTVAEEIRERWTSILNVGLERADIRTPDGVLVVLDHRSYERQGIDMEPTVKMGVSACAIERRGEISERGQINEEIRFRNELRRQASVGTHDIENKLSCLQNTRELTTCWADSAYHSHVGRVLSEWIEAQEVDTATALTQEECALAAWEQAQQVMPSPIVTPTEAESEPDPGYSNPYTPTYDGPGF